MASSPIFTPGMTTPLTAEPDVVADYCVALARQLGHVVGRELAPRAAKDIEGVGGGAADAVIGRAHDKGRTLGYGAEFADNEPVAELGVVEEHVVALEAGRVGVVIVICVVANLYVRGVDYVLYKAGGAVLIGEHLVGVGYV